MLSRISVATCNDERGYAGRSTTSSMACPYQAQAHQLFYYYGLLERSAYSRKKRFLLNKLAHPNNLCLNASLGPKSGSLRSLSHALVI